jgi:putative phage-type endonuclease
VGALISQYIDDASWHEARRGAITASEAAGLLGVSPYTSPMAIFAEKTGLVDAGGVVPDEAMEWGHRLEPLILKAYSDETGRIVQHHTRTIWRHPTAPMSATLDGTQHGHPDDPSQGIVEIKKMVAESWESDIPLMHQVQIQHQLACTGFSWATYVCLVAGRKLFWRDVYPNLEFIAHLKRTCERFWERVTNLEPPQPDDSESCRRALRAMWPEASPPVTIVLPPEAQLWDQEREKCLATIRVAEACKARVEAQIMAALGTASVGLLPDAAWKWTGKDGKRRLTRSRRKDS